LSGKRNTYEGVYRSSMPPATNEHDIKTSAVDNIYHRSSNKSNLGKRQVLTIPQNTKKLSSPKVVRFDEPSTNKSYKPYAAK
jgi:hypothetical protein